MLLASNATLGLPCTHVTDFVRPQDTVALTPLTCALSSSWLAACLCRIVACFTLAQQQQRTTTVNNFLSAARSGFRLLFGRCLTPGVCRGEAYSDQKCGSRVVGFGVRPALPDSPENWGGVR